MKNKLLSLLAATVLTVSAGIAIAGGNELAYFKISELTTLAAASVTTGDFVPVYDASAGKVKKVPAESLPLGGAFNGTVGAVTPAAGAFTTLAASGATTFDDGTGASPSITIQDGTDETVVLSKVDAGYLTATTDATDGLNILTGNLKVGNGTPGLTLGGEDAYVEGTFEVDGSVQLDGAIAVAGALTASGDIVGDGADQLYGYLQDQVASTTVAITAAQCGKTFVSNSADVMTLPEASTVLGCRYTFVCGTADDFDVNPADGTDQITSISTTNGTTAVVTLAPAAGDAIRCTDIGGSITLEAVGANAWSQVAGGNGVWTDVN